MSGLAPDSPWRLCLAPMMQRTDRHFRLLARLLAPHARLYTEMITTGALLHGPRARLLAHHAAERPLAAQLGGSVPSELAAATRLCIAAGLVEVNLNCGCPSDRVQAGTFGACLMARPARVAECVAAMREASADIAVISVKTRLGIDELYSYDYFRDFIARLAEAGCRVFHVHARKAWLAGLSPRENRELPPLEYAWVYRLKRELPGLTIVLNGGVTSSAAACRHLNELDGVMIGRHAYDVPMALAEFDATLFGDGAAQPTPAEVIARYLPHIECELAAGTALRHMARHLLNLYQGQPGARRWRRALTTGMARGDADASIIVDALGAVAPTYDRARLAG